MHKSKNSRNFATFYIIVQSMKKLVLFSVVAAAVVMMMTGCKAAKQVTYFQNIDTISLAASQYDAKIMPKDELRITVNTIDPEASSPFNLRLNTVGGGGGANSLLTYLVDNEGYINFPVVGHIHVEGLTKTQCEDLIKSKIRPYLSVNENPVVTVRMSSFRVTIQGEVGSPRVVPVAQEKMTIMEALTQAGDLTIYGKRDNILLIREDADGKKHAVRLNLNDANLINSPYYYVQQNDYIYVEPNQTMARNSIVGQSTSLWFSFTGIVMSIASMVLIIVR